MLTLSDHQRVLNDLYLTRVNGRFPNKPMPYQEPALWPLRHDRQYAHIRRGQGKITRAEDRNEHFDDVAHRAVIQRQVPGRRSDTTFIRSLPPIRSAIMRSWQGCSTRRVAPARASEPRQRRLLFPALASCTGESRP